MKTFRDEKQSLVAAQNKTVDAAVEHNQKQTEEINGLRSDVCWAATIFWTLVRSFQNKSLKKELLQRKEVSHAFIL